MMFIYTSSPLYVYMMYIYVSIWSLEEHSRCVWLMCGGGCAVLSSVFFR